MPPRSTELAILPEGVPHDINISPAPDKFKENGGITFKKEAEKYSIREEEYGGHKVFVGEGTVQAKFPREDKLRQITVKVYGDASADVERLLYATEEFQAALAKGEAPQLDPHVQEAIDNTSFLAKPRLAAVPGFILAGGTTDQSAQITTFLLSYGERIDEFMKLDPTERNRFMSTIKAGLLPIVFSRAGVVQGGYSDKILEIARDNHNTALQLPPISQPEENEETHSEPPPKPAERDQAAPSPEHNLQSELPDALKLMQTWAMNPYLFLNLRNEVNQQQIDQATVTMVSKLKAAGDLLLQRMPNEIGANFKFIYETLSTVARRQGTRAQELEAIFKATVAHLPEVAEKSKFIESLDFQSRHEVMVGIAHGQIGQYLDEEDKLKKVAETRKRTDPEDLVVHINEILTNPYLFVGLKGYFVFSDIKQHFEAFEKRLTKAQEELIAKGQRESDRFNVYSSLGVVCSAYLKTAFDLEDLLSQENQTTQLRIRNLPPKPRYQELVKLRQMRIRGRR